MGLYKSCFFLLIVGKLTRYAAKAAKRSPLSRPLSLAGSSAHRRIGRLELKKDKEGLMGVLSDIFAHVTG